MCVSERNTLMARKLQYFTKLYYSGISMAYQSLFFCIAVGIAGMIAFQFIAFAGTPGMVSERLRAFLIAGPFILILGVMSALHAKGALDYSWLFGSETSDVGPIEIGTAACFAGAALMAALVAREVRTVNRVLFGGLAIACFFIAGEEVSWGQWFFRWETPAAIAGVNLQNEINLNNLINPRLYDPVYCLAGCILIGMAIMAMIRPVRDGIAAMSVLNPIARDVRHFMNWVRHSRFGMLLTLATAVFLQHESFEEYSELLLSLTLFFFLLHMLGEMHQRIFLERRLDMQFAG